jgi:membrane-bound lytic murein transglycosylase B
MTRGIVAGLAAVLIGPALAPAAHALDTERAEVRAFIDDVAKRNRLDPAWVQQVVAAAETQQSIIDLMTRPAERVRPWHLYRAHFITRDRIEAGVKFWVEHRDELDRLRRETGVAPHVIIGILGVETFYGRITGRFRVLDALATLGFDYPPRRDYFRGELEQFLLLTRENDIDPLTVKGSYAGAMGLPQFMPRSYRAFAVDGDLDGHVDLWDSRDDVLASVANYLRKHGWERDGRVVAPATLADPDADGLVVGSLSTNTTAGELRRRGLQFDVTVGEDVPALLVGVREAEGPGYLVGFRNLAVIMRYNRSPMYALAVHQLGSIIEAELPPAGIPTPSDAAASDAATATASGTPPSAAADDSR